MSSTSEAPQSPDKVSRDSRVSKDSCEKIVTVITVALSGLAVLAAIAVPLAPPGSIREVAIACGLLAVAGLLLNAICGSTRRSIAIGSALLIAMAAALAGAAFVKSTQTTTQASVSAGPRFVQGLGISLTYHQSVPWCTSTLYGTGRIPQGYSLLIFDREVSADNQSSPTSWYSLDGAVLPSGGTWSLSPLYLGVRKVLHDFYVELTAILVTNGLANFITGISSSWATPVLPQAAQSTHAFVLRNGDLSQC